MNARVFALVAWLSITVVLMVLFGFWLPNGVQVILMILVYLVLSGLALAVIVEEDAAEVLQGILDDWMKPKE